LLGVTFVVRVLLLVIVVGTFLSIVHRFIAVHLFADGSVDGLFWISGVTTVTT
jgi:hypothetical protein